MRGLAAGRYTLKIDGEPAGTFTAEQLAQGINLAELPTPMARQAAEVHALTLRHNNIHAARWRQIQVPLEKRQLAPGIQGAGRAGRSGGGHREAAARRGHAQGAALRVDAGIDG